MTRSELVAFVKETCGPLIADAVGQAVGKAVEPYAQRTERFSAFMAGAESRDKPPAAPAREKGLAIGRYARAVAAARVEGTSPVEILKNWGDIDLADAMMTAREARKKALAASDVSAGGAIVPVQFSTDVIEFLRPQSVLRRLGATTLPMPTGTVRIPKITTGATAYYTGENANITASQPVTGNVVLTFKKLTALVPLSNDLIRYGSPAADAMVRDDVVRGIAQRENQAFIRDPGTDSTPKGMRYWAAAANVTASGGTTLALMTTDLGTLILALMNNNIPEGRWAWVMSPRNYYSLTTIQNTTGNFVFRPEMVENGTLWGFPFAKTTSVPGSGATGELYLVNLADAVIGESQNLIVDASQETAYVDSSAAVVSAYQQDQTVIRAITEHDFAMRRQESVAVITTMSW
jgi:HK97 family phage major capsid protein